MPKKRIIITIAYIILVTLLSLVRFSVPVPELEVVGFDKLVHIGFYWGLNALLIVTTMAYEWPTPKLRTTIITTIAAIAYGAMIECAQRYVGRDFDLLDIAANTIGAIVAAVVIRHPVVAGAIMRAINVFREGRR